MCGNGVVIGMGSDIIHQVHQIILQDQPQALVACVVVAVAGSAMRGAVVWLIVATILPTIATTTLGFA